MTRAELIDDLALKGPLSHKQADVVVETILDAMKGASAKVLVPEIGVPFTL